MTSPIGSPSAASHDQEAVVIVSGPGAAQPATELGGLLAAACARSGELQQWTQWTKDVLTEARAARWVGAAPAAVLPGGAGPDAAL